MKRSRWRATLGVLCLAVSMTGLPFFQSQPVSAEGPTQDSQPNTDFFTSFEKGDPQLTWVDTVETTSAGQKKASGVDGNVQYDTIQGDITDEVVSVHANYNNPPNEIDANLIDRNAQTKWLGFHPTAQITMKLSQPESVVKYAFTSANDHPGRDPQDWTLYGSNDGKNWTKLDMQTGVSFENRFQRKIFQISNDAKYLYYRFDVTKNSGEGITQLAEIALSNGVDTPPPPPAPMQSHIGNGPDSSYTAKTNVGWTGKHALSYGGTHQTKGRAYSYNKIFAVNIKVTPETQLSYYIHPEFMDKDQIDYSSTYVSIDLAFADGSYLSDLGAKDQYGVKINPQAMGDSDTLYPNQWNYILSNIGKVAAGKTIKRILVAYDDPSPAQFKGSIDDIKIVGHPKEQTYSSPAEYVNILRGTNSNGTFSRGNNIPAVAVPHGFNFWTPATDAGSLSWLYSYQQGNNDNNLPEIEAFSLSHEPSPWMGDRQTFQVMPSASTADKPPLNRDQRALAFKHSNEIAKPYYYSVTFQNGIRTEMAPTNHAAIFKFTFTGDTSSLIFDNVNNNGGLTLHPDNQTITGYTDTKSGLSAGAKRMFIYATFDKPVADSGRLTDENRDNDAGYFRFDTSGTDNKTVTMKIATSLISVAQAKKNLQQEIQPDDTFVSVKNKAKQLWNEKLSKIEVEGATHQDLVTLYSNMYRLYLYPNAAYENTGTVEDPVYKYASQFSNRLSKPTATETGAKIVKGKPYVNNGFWDTYRTAWPAYVLLSPKEAGQMIDGFVQQYKDGGWIARWSSPGYADLMVGTSADAAFADAYLKGIKKFDTKSFFNAALKDASVVSPDPATGRKGLATSIFDGYTSTSTGEGMSWAMAGYINDFAIANMAKALAEKTDKNNPKYNQYMADYKYYLNRAQNYVKMFDPKVDFFMGKTPSGDWRATPENFDPRDWGGDYTETNAWGMAFTVPQDGQGLANLYGGRKGLAEKLDEYFKTQETALHPGAYGGTIHEMREARAMRMGMFEFNNQPSHHIPYMYDYAGEPWKTQAIVRKVLSQRYLGSKIGQGYPGDEDNGEMSAWYILSAMGIYPLQQGTSDYVIGAPYFKKMTVHLENGNDIVINAPNVSDKNKYIQSVKLNGKPYNKLTISHEVLAKGATLDFVMGPKPSKWGTSKNALPKSITDSDTNGSSLLPDPMGDLTDNGKGMNYDSDGAVSNRLFDNTSETALTLDGSHPWIQYHFTDGPKKALMYTITTSKKDATQDPKSWVLIGSEDGQKWTVLDKKTNVKFKWRQYTRAFQIENPGKYAYYRLKITDNGGADSTSLAELELLGYGDLGSKFDQVEKTFQGYVKSGNISGAAETQLAHSLNQAQEQYEKGHNQQSINQLHDFLKHMDKAKSGNVSDDARTQLSADVHALIDLVTKVTLEPPRGRGTWQYHGEVHDIAVIKASDLSMSSVEPGQDANISAEVENVGGAPGDEQVDFYFDGKLTDSKTLTLKPGETQTVTFTVNDVPAGVHQVRINNLTGTLKALYPGKPVLSLHFDGTGTTVKDSSPYSFDGTLHGNATRVQGKFGNALKLEGGSWAEIPTADLLNGGDAFTIAAWVNLDDPEANQKIIGKTTIGNGYLIGVQSGKLYPELWETDGSYHTFQNGTIPAKEWVHLAFTWKKDGRFIGYVNGKEVENLPAGSASIKPNDSPLIIGAAPWDPGAFQIKGMIDEVRIFKKALSPQEIEQLYQNNKISGS
ncbi:MAG TPA: GH92 family glycosyl hydrolase [Bacillales bacterium]|nr:GH92 family glycosyl hydrolase [Bacillales bacterium]